MAGIFISYRHMDSAGFAGRLYDHLCRYFGEKLIFMDVDNIDMGEDFPTKLREVLSETDVLLAVIGKQWLIDYQGQKRLDDPNDWVRLEIASALQRGIRVIPILVDGASIPRSEDLPNELKPINTLNVFDIRHHAFDRDVDALIERVRKHVNISKERFTHRVTIRSEVQNRIYQQVEIGYPNISGGFLLGTLNKYGIVVQEALAAENKADDKRHYFTTTARDALKMEDEADEKGLTLVGYYHSYVDAPANPSSYDREHALPNFRYMIVSVKNGKATDMRVWMLSENRTKFESGELIVE